MFYPDTIRTFDELLQELFDADTQLFPLEGNVDVDIIDNLDQPDSFDIFKSVNNSNSLETSFSVENSQNDAGALIGVPEKRKHECDLEQCDENPTKKLNNL